MEPVPVVASDAHRGHDPAHEVNLGRVRSPVFERPARAEALRGALEAAGHPLVEPTEHGDSPVLAVHDPGLVRFLAEGYQRWVAAGGPPVLIPDTFVSRRLARLGREPPGGIGRPSWWCFDTATPLVEGSYAAARAAVDLALTGADLVADGAPAAYALCRPPGHHAGSDHYGGFCILNNAAVAARHLTGGGRVTVLDVDYHHGNGTQEIFWEDGAVQYVSLHGDPAFDYPYLTGHADETGSGPGAGATRNLPLPAGTDDEAYLAVLDRALDEVAAFDPATVVVSVGFDTFAGDPLGSFTVTADGYAAIGAAIRRLDRPVLFVQEGGYAVDQLGRNATRLLEGFADHDR